MDGVFAEHAHQSLDGSTPDEVYFENAGAAKYAAWTIRELAPSLQPTASGGTRLFQCGITLNSYLKLSKLPEPLVNQN